MSGRKSDRHSSGTSQVHCRSFDGFPFKIFELKVVIENFKSCETCEIKKAYET
jgi:hypothetical protein